MIANLLSLNEKQANLLASKDLQTYATLNAVNEPEKHKFQDEPSDDDLAFEEAKRRGPTEDEIIYFAARGKQFF